MGSRGKALAYRLLGRKTLILGDVGTGKTGYTVRLLESLLNILENSGTLITVVDMGPGKLGVGSPLSRYLRMPERVRYMRPEVLKAPRLEGRDAEEVIRLAMHNYEVLRPLILRYMEEPTPVLVINDLSIYLQFGPLEDLLECLRRSETFIGNSYYGLSLADDKGSGVSLRERVLVERLMGEMDYLVFLRRTERWRPSRCMSTY